MLSKIYYLFYQILQFNINNTKIIFYRKLLTLIKLSIDLIRCIIFHNKKFTYFYFMYFLFRNSLDYKKKYYFLVKLILNDKSKTSINEILKKSCKINESTYSFRSTPCI